MIAPEQYTRHSDTFWKRQVSGLICVGWMRCSSADNMRKYANMLQLPHPQLLLTLNSIARIPRVGPPSHATRSPPRVQADQRMNASVPHLGKSVPDEPFLYLSESERFNEMIALLMRARILSLLRRAVYYIAPLMVIVTATILGFALIQYCLQLESERLVERTAAGLSKRGARPGIGEDFAGMVSL